MERFDREAFANLNAPLDMLVFRLDARWMFDKTMLIPSWGCESQPHDGKKKGRKGRTGRKPLMN